MAASWRSEEAWWCSSTVILNIKVNTPQNGFRETKSKMDCPHQSPHLSGSWDSCSHQTSLEYGSTEEVLWERMVQTSSVWLCWIMCLFLKMNLFWKPWNCEIAFSRPCTPDRLWIDYFWWTFSTTKWKNKNKTNKQTLYEKFSVNVNVLLGFIWQNRACQHNGAHTQYDGSASLHTFSLNLLLALTLWRGRHADASVRAGWRRVRKTCEKEKLSTGLLWLAQDSTNMLKEEEAAKLSKGAVVEEKDEEERDIKQSRVMHLE